jgi:hypothetical protein
MGGTMSNRTYFRVLDDTAADTISDKLDLMPNIAARLERKSLMSTMHARPIVTILIVLLALLILTTAAYAIGKMTGYIPGVGIVDQSAPISILAEPVVVQRDGLTITVSKVTADSDHTFVAYTIDGVRMPEKPPLTCGVIPSLQLPNGSALSILNEDDGGPQGAHVGAIMKFEQSVTYSSIPVDVNQVTFTFPCILPEDNGPENWQILLKLSPAPKDYATPAVEIGATFVATNPKFVTAPTPTTDMRIFTPETPDTLPAMATPVSNGSGLYLDKVIELPSSYILVGSFTDAGNLPGPLVINLDPHADLPHIEDGAGNPVAFKVRADIQPENPQSGVRYWAFEIAKPIQAPVTITLDQVNIAATDTTQFKFDAGSNPQAGQKWELNLPIHLRNYDYVIDSVEAIKDGYTFKYHSGLNAENQTLFINILGSSPKQDNNGNLIQQETVVEYSESFMYPAPIPTGQLTVELSLTEFLPLHGPWTLTWTPPNK